MWGQAQLIRLNIYGSRSASPPEISLYKPLSVLFLEQQAQDAIAVAPLHYHKEGGERLRVNYLSA